MIGFIQARGAVFDGFECGNSPVVVAGIQKHLTHQRLRILVILRGSRYLLQRFEGIAVKFEFITQFGVIDQGVFLDRFVIIHAGCLAESIACSEFVFSPQVTVPEVVQTILAQQRVLFSELFKVFDSRFVKPVLVLRVADLVIVGRTQCSAVVGGIFEVRQRIFVVCAFIVSLTDELVEFRTVFDVVVFGFGCAEGNYLVVFFLVRINLGDVVRHTLFVFIRLFAALKTFEGFVVFFFKKRAAGRVVIGGVIPFTAGIFFQRGKRAFGATELFGHKKSITFFELNLVAGGARASRGHIIVSKGFVVFFIVKIVIADFECGLAGHRGRGVFAQEVEREFLGFGHSEPHRAFGIVEFGVCFDCLPLRFIDRAQQIHSRAKFLLRQSVDLLIEEVHTAFVCERGFGEDGGLLGIQGECEQQQKDRSDAFPKVHN